MTARELSIARDLVARARRERDKPDLSPKEEAGRSALAAIHEAERRAKRSRKRGRTYPVPGVASIIECPVHQLAVALDSGGRLASTCPVCVGEAEYATARLLA